ncbi:Lysine ketoglutarate reductase trans-splicing related 1, partial [Musa troglodytarum]
MEDPSTLVCGISFLPLLPCFLHFAAGSSRSFSERIRAIPGPILSSSIILSSRSMMGNNYRSGSMKKSSEGIRLTVTTILGVIFGFFVGCSFPNFSSIRLSLVPSISSTVEMDFTGDTRSYDTIVNPHMTRKSSSEKHRSGDPLKIYVESNPHGAEVLPPGIVVAETDFYLRRLWGNPEEDLTTRPKYLVTFTVGFEQRKNVDMALKKFSEDFTILLFHYDGRASEWEELEWSKRAIHVSIRKQTKWWYAKRFLHPDVVAAYDYIFIWDEDIGVEHFDAEKYLHLVKKYGLEISQPGVDPNKGLTWEMTKRRSDSEVHKEMVEKPGWCTDPHLPPCAAFVEIEAPVFSRNAWRCVWHMIQNDLVHGWGLDFAFGRCVEPAHEKIGVVDAQWIVNRVIPSIGDQ